MSTELSSKTQVLLAKNETTEGSDASPTGSANAVLLRDLSGKTLDGQTIDLNYIRSSFGASPKLLVDKKSTYGFSCDVAGSGTAGTAPGWDALIRGCGLFGATQTATTGTATASSSTSLTLAAGAPSTDDLFVGLPITAGSSVGWIKAYNGTTKVATVWEWVSGGTPASNASYSIPAFYFWKPISTGFEGTSLYRTIDALLFKGFAGKGNFQLEFAANAAPSMKYDYLATYNAPTDGGGAISGVYTAWKRPVAVDSVNTFGYFMGLPMNGAVGGSPGWNVSSLSFDAGVEVAKRTLIGVDKIKITDRKAKGSITLDAVTVATKAVHTYAAALSSDPLLLTHGTAAGNRFSLFCEDVTIDDIQDGEDNGTAQWTLPFTVNPLLANTEFRIIAF